MLPGCCWKQPRGRSARSGETQMILSCQVLHKLKKSRNAVSLWVKAERQLLGFANEHRRNWPYRIPFPTFSSQSQTRCATSVRFHATNEAVTMLQHVKMTFSSESALFRSSRLPVRGRCWRWCWVVPGALTRLHTLFSLSQHPDVFTGL